jgi:hypothetical protein
MANLILLILSLLAAIKCSLLEAIKPIFISFQIHLPATRDNRFTFKDESKTATQT